MIKHCDRRSIKKEIFALSILAWGVFATKNRKEGNVHMKQISGNKLLVKALKEEGVEVLFGYPGACTIDISDELYKQSGIDIVLPLSLIHI